MLNTFLAIKIKNRINLIRQTIENPIYHQNAILKNHIKIASKTLFGEQHLFDKIKNYDDFTNKVPIRNYNELQPYINLIKKGESDIIWPKKTKWFAKSSGTTLSRSKFIPITKDSLENCHFKAGRDMLSIYLHNNPESNILKGKSLMIGGSTSIDKLNTYYTGDLSSIIIQNLPIWVQLKRLPSIKTSLLKDWDTKIKHIIDESKNKNITSISGVPSWTIIIMNQLMTNTQINCLSEVWPNLELYMHGGISFKSYRTSFKNLTKNKNINYLELYNASEGFFGIQNNPNKSDLLLLINHGIFYEFIPVENGIQLKENVVPLHKVKTNQIYAMIITTNSGLWRYEIGDTIIFTSTNPYKIKIVGRTQSFINAFGEELNEANANRAIEYACNKTNSIVKEYIAAPIFYQDKSGAHDWYIEFEKPPKNIKEFQSNLDKKLKSINSDYEAKRQKNILLKEPIINSMHKNFFYNLLKEQKKLGGQNKIQRLHNNRKFLKQINKKL